MTPTVCLVSASGQNAFFGELFDALADALAANGVPVERAQDRFPPARSDLVYLVVPHEYMPLTLPVAHPNDAQLRRTIVLSTEQPGGAWFELAASFAERAGAVVDINRLGVDALERRGVRARHLQLGYAPAWDRWGGDPSERPVDVMFLGAHTARRGRALARCGSRLVRRRAALHVVENRLPHGADADPERFLTGAGKWQALAASKLLLNVHRDDLAYLEWQRFVEAMANGCVVVSEHSRDFEPLVPGEHFVSVSLERLPHALDVLLEDEGRLAALRDAAYAFVRETLPLERTVAPLIEAAEELAGAPIRDGAGFGGVLEHGARPVEPPPTELERIAASRTELDVLRMALKQVLLEQRDLRRTVRELGERLAGEAGEDVVATYGPAQAAAPRVSVLLTVYNYAAHVATAIESVAGSDFGDLELIVVEDKSTDDSHAVIAATLEQFPWLRAKVIARARNGGLPAARNLGLAYASGDLLFVLDADNHVYPHGLGRLVAALDAHADRVFAYGVIEQFTESGPCDLMSFLAWDPNRLRYGNYVDAMAMVRRDALMRVGGYTTDSRLFGWEDFALWCAFAQHGMGGVRVPEIVARYRAAVHSMIAVTNIDGSAAWGALAERFPFLANGSVASEALERAQR